VGDVELDQTNEGYSGTEIQAQDGFSQHYVFQANATHTNAETYVDGLHGFGHRNGRGVVGQGGTSPEFAMDDLDPSSDDLLPRSEGVLGVGGESTTESDKPGVGVRGMGGRGGHFRAATGVYGKGGFPRGHGVLGEANGEKVQGQAGTGVLGFSVRGRGATFGAGEMPLENAEVNQELHYSEDNVTSEKGIAQLRLVPSRDALPAAGRIGDLFAYFNGEEAELFLCVLSSLAEDSSPTRAAQWRPIQLGDAVTGTGVFGS
jgi:hypothetical protein